MWMALTLWACLLTALSGLPGLLSRRRAAWGQFIATLLAVSGSLLGVVAALGVLIGGRTEILALPGILTGAVLRVHLDPLAAFFMIPIFLMGAVGSVYGQEYWRQIEHPRNGRKLRLCYGLLVAALAMVTLAGDGVLFLFAWEVMALAAFFLVSTEDHKTEARQAGWVYLVGTHIGTLALFALFALLRSASGSYDLRPLPPSTRLALQTAIFGLALIGFGLKAGMMPLHFWLPGAHANAPTHVSAILSGVVLKIGIYGLLRTLMLFPRLPAGWGVLVLILGTISAVLGVVFALGQHDLKRLLAYHSIENIGIILMGMGLAMIGVSTHRPLWIVLGMAGCLLHVWNHCLFKSLLFLAAGSVVHAMHTREIDQMGGLAKRMPLSAGLFAIGAVAICGLPPLNGFVSELLIYVGLFKTAANTQAGAWSAVGLAAPALALVGALALACFVKAFGAVFLGSARTPPATHAEESPASMVIPMAVLAGLCVSIGLFPIAIVPMLEKVTRSWAGASGLTVRLADAAPIRLLTACGLALIVLVTVAAVLARSVLRQRPARDVGTWDCGYTRPSARMQYTASSFAQSLVLLFRWVLKPHVHPAQPGGPFPGGSAFQSHVPEPVLDGILMPTWIRLKTILGSARILQQGRVQGYLMYILVILFVLLLSLVPFLDLIRRMLAR